MKWSFLVKSQTTERFPNPVHAYIHTNTCSLVWILVLVFQLSVPLSLNRTKWNSTEQNIIRSNKNKRLWEWRLLKIPVKHRPHSNTHSLTLTGNIWWSRPDLKFDQEPSWSIDKSGQRAIDLTLEEEWWQRFGWLTQRTVDEQYKNKCNCDIVFSLLSRPAWFIDSLSEDLNKPISLRQ